jgi:ribosomal protein L33
MRFSFVKLVKRSCMMGQSKMHYCKRCNDHYDPSRPNSRGDIVGTNRIYLKGYCRHCSLAVQHGTSVLSELSEEEKSGIIRI